MGMREGLMHAGLSLVVPYIHLQLSKMTQKEAEENLLQSILLRRRRRHSHPSLRRLEARCLPQAPDSQAQGSSRLSSPRDRTQWGLKAEMNPLFKTTSKG